MPIFSLCRLQSACTIVVWFSLLKLTMWYMVVNHETTHLSKRTAQNPRHVKFTYASASSRSMSSASCTSWAVTAGQRRMARVLSSFSGALPLGTCSVPDGEDGEHIWSKAAAFMQRQWSEQGRGGRTWALAGCLTMSMHHVRNEDGAAALGVGGVLLFVPARGVRHHLAGLCERSGAQCQWKCNMQKQERECTAPHGETWTMGTLNACFASGPTSPCARARSPVASPWMRMTRREYRCTDSPQL